MPYTSHTRTHSFRRLLFLLPLLMMALAAPWPADAQGAPAVIRTEPTTLAMEPGEIYEFPVLLENAFEAFAIDVRMRFDPAMIEVVDAIPEIEGVQLLQGSFPKPDFAARYAADNAADEKRRRRRLLASPGH